MSQFQRFHHFRLENNNVNWSTSPEKTGQGNESYVSFPKGTTHYQSQVSSQEPAISVTNLYL